MRKFVISTLAAASLLAAASAANAAVKVLPIAPANCAWTVFGPICFISAAQSRPGIESRRDGAPALR